MKVNEITRSRLAIRRESREMERRGYKRHETDWEIHRGYRMGEIITDAVVSVDGLYVYTKVGGCPCCENRFNHVDCQRFRGD